MDIDDLRGNFNYAMHGCGAYKGILHSNSIEAYNHWRKRIRIFEADVVETADGEFVLFASHGISDNDLYRLEIYHPVSKLYRTKKYLLNQKLFTKSSTGMKAMSLHFVLDEMRSNPDLIFIFDLFGLWNKTAHFAKYIREIIGDSHELLKRVILEVYYEKQIIQIQDVDAAFNVMYCIKEKSLPYSNEMTLERLKSMGVSIISYPWNNIEDFDDLRKYVESGFLIMSLSHTNWGSQKKKRLGVNINNVDIVYARTNLYIELPSYFLGRVRWYIVKAFDRYIRKLFNQ